MCPILLESLTWKNQGKSPHPARTPLPRPPLGVLAPLRCGGTARSGALGCSRTAATLGGVAPGEVSQQGLWRSCVAVLSAKGGAPVII